METISNTLLSFGLFLAFFGVYRMTKAKTMKIGVKEYTDLHGFENKAAEKKYKRGKKYLYIGFIFQMIGIWFIQIFQGISSAFASTPAVKNVPGAEEMSWATVEAVLNNLDRLATYGIWAISIILGIAVFIVGYNFVISERTIRNLRSEFKEEIDRARKELDEHITILNLIQSAESERTRAGLAVLSKNYDIAAKLWSSAIQIYISARSTAEEKIKERIDSLIEGVYKMLEVTLKTCKDKKLKPDLEIIKENISMTPQDLSARREQIENMLDEFGKKN